MKSIVDSILVPQARLEIFNQKIRSEIDLKAWIANQNYFIDDDLKDGVFELRPADDAFLYTAFANDCNRMAVAAIESAAGLQIDPCMNRSGAWGIIRAYYSAFFAIHAILRMYGISCTQVDQEYANKIFEIGHLFDKTSSLARIEKGFYSIEISANSSLVKFTKYKESHAGTWRRFLELLDVLMVNSRSLTSLSSDKIEAIRILSTIKSGVTRASHSKGNWLSAIRNSVNYQHSHGAWFPYERRSIACAYLPRMANEWKKQVSELAGNLENGEVEAFFQLVLLIMSLFRELLVSCNRRCFMEKSVFAKGSLKLLKTLRLD